MKQKCPIFQISIKTGEKVINVPVWKEDTYDTIANRIISQNKKNRDLQCGRTIQQKIVYAFDAMLLCETIPQKLRLKIQQFVNEADKNESVITEIAEKDQTKEKTDKSENKKEKEELSAKLYQIKKNVFSHNHNDKLSLDLKQSQINNVSLNLKKSLKNSRVSKNVMQKKKKQNKENDSDIIKRIQKKIAYYEKQSNYFNNKRASNPILTELSTQSKILEPVQNPDTGSEYLTNPRSRKISRYPSQDHCSVLSSVPSSVPFSVLSLNPSRALPLPSPPKTKEKSQAPSLSQGPFSYLDGYLRGVLKRQYGDNLGLQSKKSQGKKFCYL